MPGQPNTEPKRQPDSQITASSERPARSAPDSQGAVSRTGLEELLYAATVLAGASIVFGLLFNRETALSYSIGYNLYGATRVLAGEVPYRDFHTLYPPATVYLNALLFRLFGTSLYTALAGVFVFKVLTTLVIYLCARMVMSRPWSFAAAAFSIIWLRPNGPFKAVPMHYGALFLALALLLVLIYASRQALIYLFAGGVSLGILLLFKHNIGAYGFIGLALSLPFDGNPFALKLDAATLWLRRLGALVVGFLAPVIPVVWFIHRAGALTPMARTLFFGPGEFLLSRLAATPSTVFPVLILVLLASSAFAVHRLRSRPELSAALALLVACCLVIFLAFGPEGPLSEIVFYAPVIILLAGAVCCRVVAKEDARAGRQLYAVAVAAAAAFMESFPRFAREQSIAAMPLIGLLLLCILYVFRQSIFNWAGGRSVFQIALATLPLALFALGAGFFCRSFFVNGLHLRSNTSLATPRGKGVFFPSETANEIDQVVEFVQGKVPEGGYLFAQSYAGSSYLFLADRGNPSGAQFWGGVGVSRSEREQTLASIQQKNVQLVITSHRDMEAEKFRPLSQYLERNFRPSTQIGEVVILERVPEQ
jgi:hypothetical protein